MEIMKVAIIGLIGAVLASSLKNWKSDFNVYISLGAVVVLMFYVVSRLTGIVDQIRTLVEMAGTNDGDIAILLKMIGITYLVEFASAICKDLGHQALAMQIENFGKLSLLAISVPVIGRLISLIGNMA